MTAWIRNDYNICSQKCIRKQLPCYRRERALQCFHSKGGNTGGSSFGKQRFWDLEDMIDLTIINYQRNTNPKHNEITLYTCQNGCNNNQRKEYQALVIIWRNWNLTHCQWECESPATLETQFVSQHMIQQLQSKVYTKKN